MAGLAEIARSLVLAGVVTVSIVGGARAAVIGFVANPTGNFADWTTHLAATGAGTVTVIDFEAHPVGPLNGSFYTGQGVSMSITAPDFEGVLDVTGVPAGSSDCPCSTGEGPFPLSRALIYNDRVSLIVSFANAVSAFGMLTGDHYDPAGTDPITIEAFTGTDATGTSLGSFQSAPFNFQLGYSYFMGIASGTNEIRSVRITDALSGTNDGVDLDDFRLAMVNVPEPATLSVFGLAVAGLLGLRRRG